MLKLYRERIAVCCENYTKYIVCGKNGEFLSIKLLVRILGTVIRKEQTKFILNNRSQVLIQVMNSFLC